MDVRHFFSATKEPRLFRPPWLCHSWHVPFDVRQPPQPAQVCAQRTSSHESVIWMWHDNVIWWDRDTMWLLYDMLWYFVNKNSLTWHATFSILLQNLQCFQWRFVGFRTGTFTIAVQRNKTTTVFSINLFDVSRHTSLNTVIHYHTSSHHHTSS